MRKLLTILGPTASGKTALAVQACARFGGEVLSADSRQFYRGMDIGTGKDLDEFLVDGIAIPCHLIDIADAGETLNVYDFFLAYRDALKDVLSRGKLPVLCGGSGQYIETALRPSPYIAIPPDEDFRSSLYSLDKGSLKTRFNKLPDELRESQDDSTGKRMIRALEIGRFLEWNPAPKLTLPDTDPVLIGVKIDRETRRRRISQRLKKRMEEGLLEEVEELQASGISFQGLKYYGLEYKYMALHLEGQLSLDEAESQLETAIHQFAKRQMTWFRGMERRGWQINWLDYHLATAEKLERIEKLLT